MVGPWVFYLEESDDIIVTTQQENLAATQAVTSNTLVDINDETITLPNTGNLALITLQANYELMVAGDQVVFAISDGGVDDLTSRQIVKAPATGFTTQSTTVQLVVIQNGQVIKGRCLISANTLTLRVSTNSTNYLRSLEF